LGGEKYGFSWYLRKSRFLFLYKIIPVAGQVCKNALLSAPRPGEGLPLTRKSVCRPALDNFPGKRKNRYFLKLLMFLSPKKRTNAWKEL
jgi:hypothetical protein